MTQAEFKAWFEGFSENIEDSPTKKQWARICKRVEEIDGAPLTLPIYIDRWRDYQRYPHWYCTSNSTGVGISNSAGGSLNQAAPQAMLYSAGRAEYEATA